MIEKRDDGRKWIYYRITRRGEWVLRVARSNEEPGGTELDDLSDEDEFDDNPSVSGLVG